MQVKLTLTMEHQAVEQAKAYAKKQGTSLSKLFQEFLKQKAVETEEPPNQKDLPKLSKKLAHLYGALELPEGLSEKEALQEYLLKKHG